uniref:Ketoreductase domain-containing protein n=1 Tax=Heterosigma akashiwo TaxID=2829 RepID=A0A7S4DIP7_HETAK
MMNFKNKVAVVTGAGRGIGAATAQLLAKFGASVVVNDIDEERARNVVNSISGQPGCSSSQAFSVIGSVSDAGFPELLLSEAASSFGRIDVIVNNAGFTWDGVLHKMEDDQWDKIIECHGTGAFRMIRAAAPYMREMGKQEVLAGQVPSDRSIINISSTSGLHGNAGQGNYSFAKMGLVGLTKTVAKEWGRFGVRCNTVAFGFIDTRLTRPADENCAEGTMHVGQTQIAQGLPKETHKMLKSKMYMEIATALGRFGTVEEAASGVVFMASPMASYVTGHTLEVTGGLGM